MESQLARCEVAPRSLCDFCWHESLQYGNRRRVDRHVSWTKRRKPFPKQLLRMSACVFCSVLMEVVRHREEDEDEIETEFLELPILTCRRAMKRSGGYDWEDCSIISLLPIRRHKQYSGPSGCTDLGFLAMTKARDEADPQSAMTPINGQYRGVLTEAKRALDFEYIQELASICTRQHGATCASNTSPRVPGLRVIDCTTGSVVDAPAECCYLALSYVWGDPATTTAEDEETVFKPLVRDSITITQKLGFRYLWVDRHCIDQDDAYKHTMINRMGDVYSQAHITIVIATGTGANDRIHHLDGVNQVLDIRVEGQIATRVFTHAVCALGESTWASRAWTYQEAYLSRRRLIFTDKDILFLCNHALAAESSKVCIENTTLLRSQQSDIWKFIPPPQTETRYHLYRAQTETLIRQISDYTKKHLTYDSDSLDAFVGVLAETTQKTDWDPIRQVWGVPHNGRSGSQMFWIDWRHEKGARRRPGFPSWSWCGWAGEASFDKKRLTPTYREDCSFALRLETGERAALNENTRHPTKPGEMPQDLLITARVVPCRLAPGADQVTSPARPWLVFQVDDDAFARTPVWLDDPQLCPEIKYTGIFLEHELSEIHAMTMLVVKAVDDHYERVGLVELYSNKQYLTREFVPDGKRVLHDRFNCEPWMLVQFCNVQYVDGEGTPYAHFKPDKLHLQPWYRDGDVKEICLR